MKTRRLMLALAVLTIAPTTVPIVLPIARAEVQRDDFRMEADLIEASTQGQTWQVRALLDKGAGLETRDRQNGWTPLMWAARGGHVGTVRFLLARGAKVNRRSVGDARSYMVLANSTMGVTTSDAASGTIYGRVGSFGSVNNGLTPLILASIGGYNLAARELLSKGADVNARTSSGETALMAAAFNGYLPLVQTLLARGANVSARDVQGNMALASAVLEGHTPVVRELLKHGASPNELYLNRTPLLAVAKYYNYDEIAGLLRRHGAGAAVKTTRTKTKSKRAMSANAVRRDNRNGAPAASGPNVIILN